MTHSSYVANPSTNHPINRPFGDHLTSPQSYRYAQLHKPLLGMTDFVILQYLSNIIPLLSYINPCSHDSIFCFTLYIYINQHPILIGFTGWPCLPMCFSIRASGWDDSPFRNPWWIPAGHGIFPGIILLHGGGTKEKDFKGLERWEEWLDHLDLRRSAEKKWVSLWSFFRIANWTKSPFLIGKLNYFYGHFQ